LEAFSVMWFLTSRIGRFVSSLGLVILGLATFGEYQRRKERQAIDDEMAAAYNTTTKEVRNAQTDLPSDPVAVLDSLREFAERGKRRGDT
jgi:hypothetical protein